MMNADHATTLALDGRDVRKTFRGKAGEAVRAVDGVSLEVRPGTLTALVGPDGAGKTTLIRLIAGLLAADAGMLRVLGIDVAADPHQVQSRIGYMPQRFGLYEDLTVQENLDLYADMHGLGRQQRRERYPQLMEMTALGPFTDRLAGRLSGGMKQKLGLACTLVRSPELLLLDEPTVGVDPLSRRELWKIVLQLVGEGLTVLLSTSYLNEAERCEHVVVLHQGKVLSHGPPGEVRTLAEGRTFVAVPSAHETARGLQSRLLDDPAVLDAVPEGGRVRFVRAGAEQRDSDGAEERGLRGPVDRNLPGVEGHDFRGAKGDSTAVPARFEDGFMVLLRRVAGRSETIGSMGFDRRVDSRDDRPAVRVRNLVRRFGPFTAVDNVSFEVHRGEVFGLLGPNGAGKTTTFRMLCGLLTVSGGTLEVAGVDLHRARAEARQRIGYVAQKFSLYGQLSVAENLDFFASAYGLRGGRKRERIDWALRQFALDSLGQVPSGQLPGGYKQRLAMAASLLHEPEILFLDEPTSGADPLARREFWRRITVLAQQGVTVIVTTHFMEEAEYCDRVAIMDAGRVLAQGSPADVRHLAQAEPGREPTMEDAFIAVVLAARENEILSAANRGGAA